MIEYIRNKYPYMLIYPDSHRNSIKYGVQCEAGWHPLIKEMIDIISRLDIRKEVNIFQIKEKFGCFRFYFNTSEVSNKHIIEVVRDFTIKIDNTCELCGAPGTISKSENRVQTLCEACNIEG